MFERITNTPLPASGGRKYRDISYDGCHFYLTVSGECKVEQHSRCFEKEQCYDTIRVYTALCYDPEEDCFWAASDAPSVVYKLNRCFEEIDCIIVCGPGKRRKTITGLSYDCCERAFLVCFADEIMHVEKNSPQKGHVLVTAKHEWFFAVVSIYPYILCYCMEGEGFSVRLYSSCGDLLQITPVSCDFGLEGAVFWPCAEDCCCCHFCVLHTKHGRYSYLSDYVLTCDAVCHSIHPCNWALCHHCCDEPCQEACQEVLQSIAKMETALAHILNAEGEKIQKIVAESDDPRKMLAVNESVNKTLSKAVILEQLLCSKLESLSKCCDLCTRDEA